MKEEQKNTGLKVLVVILTLCIICLVAYIVYDNFTKTENKQIIENNKNEDSDNKLKKVDDEKDIVYTKYNFKINNYNNAKESNIPQINLKSDLIDEINNEIVSVIMKNMNTESFKNEYEYASDDNNIYSVDYEYNMNNNILSLVVKYYELTEGDPNEGGYYYMIYNIDMEKNIKLLNSDIINENGYDCKQVYDEIKNQIGKYYYDLAQENKLTWNVNDAYDNNTKIENKKISDMYFNTLNSVAYIGNDTQIYSPLYIDKDGKINVVLVFETPYGGAGLLEKNIVLFK